MTTLDPRQQLRDLIAIRLHAVECGCEHYRRDGSDADDTLYTHMADAVMDLFPEVVERRENHSGNLVLPVDGPGWTSSAPVTHTRLTLSTAPTPTGTPARAIDDVERVVGLRVRQELADLTRQIRTARPGRVL